MTMEIVDVKNNHSDRTKVSRGLFWEKYENVDIHNKNSRDG